MRKRHRSTTNLLLLQARDISSLALRIDVLVVNCHKNLGPAVINTSTFVERAYLDHLSYSTTYKEVTEEEAKEHMLKVSQQIQHWLKKYSTSTKTRQILKNKI